MDVHAQAHQDKLGPAGRNSLQFLLDSNMFIPPSLRRDVVVALR